MLVLALHLEVHGEPEAAPRGRSGEAQWDCSFLALDVAIFDDLDGVELNNLSAIILLLVAHRHRSLCTPMRPRARVNARLSLGHKLIQTSKGC